MKNRTKSIISHCEQNFQLSPTSWLAGIVLVVIFFTNLTVLAVNTGDEYKGYKVIEKHFVKEVNAECIYLEHIASGARVFKILSNDPNKTFCIAFQTVPESDNGAPHILEHCLLNGSKNYPVKSPYEILSKGSLNTMLNAFTSKDMTRYPIASMNEKDYFNLMNVCLDGMFNPMFIHNPKTLKQEGWHYELTDKDSPIIYKGVVYNEMKGAFSSPNRELSYQIYKNLFPDNGYSFESGGYPAAIPTLTQDAFVKFYKKYYHPGNSYIFLYGDADLKKELALLDTQYLSKFTRSTQKVNLPDQKPFPSLKKVNSFYPVLEGAEMKDQTYLTLNYLAGSNTDQVLSMALDIISEVLLNQESAPLRLALQQSGIGKDFSASTSNYKQNVFQISVINANENELDRFHAIVDSVLRQVIAKGYDKKAVQGVLNRTEFQLREGNDAQKGLSYSFLCTPGWIFAGDPFLGIEYEKQLTELKKRLENGYLEKVTEQYLLNSQNTLLLSMAPKPNLDKDRNDKVVEELKKYKASLNEEQLNSLVAETKDLIAYQQREDTPEQLATIPLLSLNDINPVAASYPVKEQQVDNVKLLHHEEFTNNVVYVNLYFNLNTLPQELIPYASLLTNYLSNLDTKNYTYGDLNTELNIQTGTFYTNLNTYLENDNDNQMLAKFVVTSKAMNDKLDKLFGLSSEILLKTSYADNARLQEILDRLNAQLQQSLKSNGLGIARNRLTSYFTKTGQFNELTSGMDFTWFIKDLDENFSTKVTEIRQNLSKVASLLFTKNNLIVSTTCSASDLPKVTTSLKGFINQLPAGTANEYTWSFNPENKKEGYAAPSKVQFVIEGYDFKKLGYTWNGKMRVLSQILSSDYLHNKIRVQGGAYGGFSSISSKGTFTFNSYRDPNLKETLDNYAGTVDYLKNFKVDEPVMTRYIIGTISGMDSPLAPSAKGDLAFNRYFSKKKQADIQRERDEVLAVKQEDIRGYADMVRAVLDQKTYCIYGNADKINASGDLFSKVITLGGSQAPKK